MFSHHKKEVEIVDEFGNPTELNLNCKWTHVCVKGTNVEYSALSQEIIESEAKTSRQPRVIFTDKITGNQMSARQDFIDKLPRVLGVGIVSIKHVRAILTELGCEYADDTDGKRYENDSRQLRDAKAYLVSESNVPIISVQAQDGGYYIADNPADLDKNAAAFRTQADGLIRSAEALEALAEQMRTQIRRMLESIE